MYVHIYVVVTIVLSIDVWMHEWQDDGILQGLLGLVQTDDVIEGDL
jgi:hypothetical protein